jgi:hypothetical protein
MKFAPECHVRDDELVNVDVPSMIEPPVHHEPAASRVLEYTTTICVGCDQQYGGHIDE